jgi:hypothetical protein
MKTETHTARMQADPLPSVIADINALFDAQPADVRDRSVFYAAMLGALSARVAPADWDAALASAKAVMGAGA